MSSPPTTLGQYQIIREIARSNDIVYEAYDPLMNRRVAVKELSMPSGTESQKEDRINRFKREAQAAGTLNHANIMTVYSFAEDAGRTFMAMEYLDGQTLRNEIDTRGAIPVERAVEIASAVLAGLEHAHSKGVIHRDIKPDNIQILSNGSIKITDFGIARLTFQPNLTMDGQVFGTPSYMSPEQVVGREIDARSDLFSVGVLLYEMLTGTKPFAGDSVVSITYAIMNREPDQPQQIPWAIWQVIHRALEKSPSLRYSSAADMKQALEDAARPEQAKSAMPGVDPMTGVPNPYAMPLAPPISPGYGVPTPQTNPYNPYAPPGAGANPYASQYGQPTPPPVSGGPINFPYNPYQQQTGAYPPNAGQPGQIPVYYPPPPRQPLFKPESVVFMKKLTLTFLIIGTLFAVILVGFTSIEAIIGHANQENDWRKQEQANTESSSNVSLADRIQEEEKLLQTAPDSDKARVRQNLGALYHEKAAQDYKASQFDTSELDLQQAAENNPTNPQVFVDLGNLYLSQADKVSDPSDRAKLYEQGSNSYQKAIEQESQAAAKKADGLSKAKASYLFAYNAIQTDDVDMKRRARAALEDAATFASEDQDLAARINDLLTRFRSS